MIELTEFLSKDFDYQYWNTEALARWNLPDDIALDWICSEGIIKSDNLTKAIPFNSIEILKEIFLRFDRAYDNENNEDLWTYQGMKNHPFWIQQRVLAKQFISSIKDIINN